VPGSGRCEGVVMARLESPLGVENGLVEPNLEAHPPEGLSIALTLVRDCLEVPVRVLMLPVATTSSRKESHWQTMSQSHW
jgi:hypothetical protein